MITDRQKRIFELTAVHGCTQGEAGSLIDPPLSQAHVSRILKDLYETHPELKAVCDYIRENSDFQPASHAPRMLSYDSSMDSQVVAKF